MCLCGRGTTFSWRIAPTLFETLAAAHVHSLTSSFLCASSHPLALSSTPHQMHPCPQHAPRMATPQPRAPGSALGAQGQVQGRVVPQVAAQGLAAAVRLEVQAAAVEVLAAVALQGPVAGRGVASQRGQLPSMCRTAWGGGRTQGHTRCRPQEVGQWGVGAAQATREVSV